MASIKPVSGNPDPLAPFSEKKTDEYGLKIARLISSEWFDGGIISDKCEFMNRRNYVYNNRLFTRGEQDIQNYKNLMSKGDNDLSLMNLDWSVINIVHKFYRLVSNGISEQFYRLDIRSIDKLSLNLRKEKERHYKKYMAADKYIQNLKKTTGVDLMPDGYIPEDEEEMNLWMQIKDRPKIEIAEELLIQYIKSSNDWMSIEQAKNKDLVSVGLTGVRVWIDDNDGVKIEYVDPENYIHSYVNNNNFNDKFYEGVVDTITLSDLRRESGFSEEQLRSVAKLYGKANGKNNISVNYDTCGFDELVDYKVDVLRFAWKTSKKIVYKAKKRKGKIVKVTRKDESYQAPDRNDVEKLEKTLDTWFEGNYIIGSNAIYGYKECENIMRDQMNKAMSPFVMRSTDIYKNRLRSFLDDIKPIANQMQQIHLKIQQLYSELRPDIIEVDIDMLAELDDGKGGVKREVWQTALDMMNVNGVVFSKRVNMGEDGIKDTTAVRPVSQSQGSALGVLLNLWAHYYNQIRDISGVNPAADGSLPADALVGISQLARMASATATKHIVDASVEHNKRINEVISSRIKSVYSHPNHNKLTELYNNVVGENVFGHLKILENRHLNEFGFTYEMLPTQEETSEFNEVLNQGIREGSVHPETVIRAKSIAKTNMKLAQEYLIWSRKRFIKENQQNQMALAENKSMNDAKAAQAKTQADTQAYALKKNIDLEYKRKESQIKLLEEQALLQIKAPVEDKKFQQEVYLTRLERVGKIETETFKEDRKDERTKIQAEQQSKIVNQRNKDTGPIDFTSGNTLFA